MTSTVTRCELPCGAACAKSRGATARRGIGSVAGLAQQHRQRADGRGERQFLRIGLVDLERHRLHHRRLERQHVGGLVDGEHQRLLNDDVVRRRILVELPGQHDVDVIAGQDETGDALDVVDPHGDGLHPGAQHRGKASRAGRDR